MESDGTKRTERNTERTGGERKQSDLRDRNHSNREASDLLYPSDVIPLDLKSRMVVVHDNLSRLLKEAIPENEAWDNLGARPSESMLKTLETFSRMCYFLSKEFYDLEQELEKEIREPRLDFSFDQTDEAAKQEGPQRGPRRDTNRRDTNRRDPQRSRESRRWSSQANTRVGQYL